MIQVLGVKNEEKNGFLISKTLIGRLYLKERTQLDAAQWQQFPLVVPTGPARTEANRTSWYCLLQIASRYDLELSGFQEWYLTAYQSSLLAAILNGDV